MDEIADPLASLMLPLAVCDGRCRSQQPGKARSSNLGQRDKPRGAAHGDAARGLGNSQDFDCAREGQDRRTMRAVHRREAEAEVPARDSPDQVQLSGRSHWQVAGRPVQLHHSLPVRLSRKHRRRIRWPFTRLDHVNERLSETRVDVMWLRHTEQWWLVHRSVTLEEALRPIETEPFLQPHA